MSSHAHSFSDPASWGDLPPELRGLPGRVLRDRYWQVGISSGTREDFYSQIEESKLTMEGLASTIRSSLRMVREVSYRLLYSMSLLGGALYNYKELPEPLAKALFTDAAALTIHQTGIILAGLPSLIYNCPPEARAHFIPPVLTAMFDFLDRKVSTEWERIDQRSKAAAPDDDLIEEMKDEAILRQLTNTSVQVVVRLLEPDPRESLPSRSSPSGQY
jgi:exportin-5